MIVRKRNEIGKDGDEVCGEGGKGERGREEKTNMNFERENSKRGGEKERNVRGKVLG